MLGTPKVVGSSLTRACFFKRNILFQKKILGQLFVWCVGLVVTSWIWFFKRAFLSLVLSVWFAPRFCNFTYLDFIFPAFFCFAKIFLGQIYFGLFFHRPNDLILGFFKINTILANHSALIMLVVCLPICLLKFHFFSFWIFFTYFLLPAYSPRVLFLLDPLLTAFEKEW